MGALACALTPSAYAQDNSGWYAMGGYSHTEYESDDYFNFSDSYGAVTFGGGYDFNRFLGVEAEGAIGVVDGEDTISGFGPVIVGPPDNITGTADIDSTFKLNSRYGVYAKAQYPVTDSLSIFGRVGFESRDYDFTTKTTVVATDGAQAVFKRKSSISEDSVAFGGGVEFDVTEKQALRAGYTRAEGDVNEDRFEVSYVYRFGK
tara:strand:+ start:5488 stop:6099 length:612 start_codon:yes stop_codon:yes gene_type:complete